MPRVLRIINRFNLGGPTYNAANLTRYLDPDFETMLVGGMNDPSEANSCYILDELGVKYHIIKDMQRSIHPVHDLRAYLEISRLIQSFRPDIVHTHASKAGALGRVAAIRHQVPLIVHTFHGHVLESYFSPLKARIFTGIERYLARHTDRIIALSGKQKEELCRLLALPDPGKVAVIPLGFDLSKFFQHMEAKRAAFRARYFLDENTVAVGIVGRLVPVKNHALFLRAVRHAMDHAGRPFRAFIIGDGEERASLEKMATEMGILFGSSPVQGKHNLLTFTSWIREMDVVMAGLDLVALTSLNEGTPVSLIEAQAAGKAIVSTRVGGIEDVVIPDVTALLSDQRDEMAFRENFLKLIQDDSLRERLTGKGRERAAGRYHYRRLAGEMSALYHRLLAEKSHLPASKTG